MEIVFSVTAAAILIALYKYFPNKKIFSYFCILLCVVFATSAYINNRHTSQEILSQEQIDALRNQQNIFRTWYADYQKNIDNLDRIWQIYFDFVDDLNSAQSAEKFLPQIEKIEVEAIDRQIKIHNLQIPDKLDDNCKIILAEIIRKTQTYSDAQVKVISLVKAAVAAEKNLPALQKNVKNITIRESPTGLFTANEILEIREILTVPEDVDKVEKLSDTE